MFTATKKGVFVNHMRHGGIIYCVGWTVYSKGENCWFVFMIILSCQYNISKKNIVPLHPKNYSPFLHKETQNIDIRLKFLQPTMRPLTPD